MVDVLCIFVHGTRLFPRRSKRLDWRDDTAPLPVAIRHANLGAVMMRHFDWSGVNSHHARVQASAEFRDWLLELVRQHQPRRLVVVAHSHGGNVVLYALRDEVLRHKVTDLVMIGVPIIRCEPRLDARALGFFLADTARTEVPPTWEGKVALLSIPVLMLTLFAVPPLLGLVLLIPVVFAADKLLTWAFRGRSARSVYRRRAAELRIERARQISHGIELSTPLFTDVRTLWVTARRDEASAWLKCVTAVRDALRSVYPPQVIGSRRRLIVAGMTAWCLAGALLLLWDPALLVLAAVGFWLFVAFSEPFGKRRGRGDRAYLVLARETGKLVWVVADVCFSSHPLAFGWDSALYTLFLRITIDREPVLRACRHSAMSYRVPRWRLNHSEICVDTRIASDVAAWLKSRAA